MDQSEIFPINASWIRSFLAWADIHYPFLAYFNPNSIPYPHGGFEQVLFGGKESFTLDEIDKLPRGKEKIGILAYDLKNQFERLQSSNPSLIDCPDNLFFLPCIKVKFTADSAEIIHNDPTAIFEKIKKFQPPFKTKDDITITALTSREEYLQKVQKIKHHIVEGDIYELNFCMAFQGFSSKIDPVNIYYRLMEKSPMPFSVFFKAGDQYLVGASPERFLKKQGATIIAQPIKGTIKRGNSDQEDELLKQQLQSSEKERSENLMIVDLMRNDLSKISHTGKVKVEELFGVYAFKRIHQMISTVSSTLREPIQFKEIVAKTFPMGSMTGAPKIKCMELIDQYENFKRGWFSGAVGYISADGDFDFNVIIRSVIIDKKLGTLFFAVGSAITYDADPGQEYEECLLKAQPLFEALESET